jgi:hypothetical protein
MGAIRGLLLAILAAGQVHCQSGQSTTDLFTFPKGYWIENIAVRSNGNLLLTRMDKAEVYEMNPFVHPPQHKLLHAFTDGNNSCMGIAENSLDNFAVIVRTRNGNTTRSAVWNLDITSADPKVRKIVDNINGALNGLSLLAPDVVIATDTPNGNLYRIDLKAGQATVAHKSIVGVNGVRVQGKYVYFANTRNGAFMRLPVEAATGLGSAPAEAISQPGIGIDDFALSPFSEEAFVVNQHRDQLIRVSLTGNGKVDTVAGSRNSTTISAPTSAHFGRTSKDARTLYVTTSGKRPGNITSPDPTPIGGRIIALTL